MCLGIDRSECIPQVINHIHMHLSLKSNVGFILNQSLTKHRSQTLGHQIYKLKSVYELRLMLE